MKRIHTVLMYGKLRGLRDRERPAETRTIACELVVLHDSGRAFIVGAFLKSPF